MGAILRADYMSRIHQWVNMPWGTHGGSRTLYSLAIDSETHEELLARQVCELNGSLASGWVVGPRWAARTQGAGSQ